MMKYNSTRNKGIAINSAAAIAKGISDEGGLFVPVSFPSIKDRLKDFSKLNYKALAKEIFKLYLTDFSDEEISDCVEKAYSDEKFYGDEPVSFSTLSDNLEILELWHGPTCAFKDMALQILPHFLTKSLEKTGQEKTALILVATSGDTGKAALEGFKNIDKTKVCVFYPSGGVSPMQLLQMNTQEGDNVMVCAVKGNFDDCQNAVKQIFASGKINEELADKNIVLSSANSINWGRLLPQIVYYVYSYVSAAKDGKFEEGDEINVVVPTGNFGNILAAYYAKKMGVPINKFICASNSNNVLTDFIREGVYDKSRDFYTTITPSMDILISSNLERFLYDISGSDSEKITSYMAELSKCGKYSVDGEILNKIKTEFYASCCDDDATLEVLGRYFKEYNYLMDTHTAVAVKVYEDYIKDTGDDRYTVLASTASPYKFGKSVLCAISSEQVDDEFEIVDIISKLSNTEIPSSILELKEKSEKFDNLVTKENIGEFVLNLF